MDLSALRDRERERERERKRERERERKEDRKRGHYPGETMSSSFASGDVFLTAS